MKTSIYDEVTIPPLSIYTIKPTTSKNRKPIIINSNNDSRYVTMSRRPITSANRPLPTIPEN